MRTLTREEGKLITRRRLIEAAARILRESGYGGLSASAVAREAGVAQPTFYVHFADKEALVRALASEKVEAIRKPLKDARARIVGGGLDALRETFRVSLAALVEQPELFRLFVQEAQQPGSPFGEQARLLQRELEADLVDDLVALGAPGRSREERLRLEMMADGIVTLTERLGMGHIDGRYPDLNAVIEVLTQVAVGSLRSLGIFGS
ncbi:MAG TPA: TetR family transcriptional regulator [Polyangiaceae bacterium]|nr:TetR family transcriptional regulator [Polyangiaceae bacterium]